MGLEQPAGSALAWRCADRGRRIKDVRRTRDAPEQRSAGQRRPEACPDQQTCNPRHAASVAVCAPDRLRRTRCRSGRAAAVLSSDGAAERAADVSERAAVPDELPVSLPERAARLAAGAAAIRDSPAVCPRAGTDRSGILIQGTGYDPRTLNDRARRLISSNAVTSGRSVK